MNELIMYSHVIYIIPKPKIKQYAVVNFAFLKCNLPVNRITCTDQYFYSFIYTE